MKIGINARGLSIPVGGVASYMDRLIPRLIRTDRTNDYVVFHSSCRHVGSFAGAQEVFIPPRHPLLWENVWLSRAARKYGIDALFCPKNLVPLFLPRTIKTIAVVLDLLYFPVMGERFSEYLWQDTLYMRLFLRRSLKRTDRIIAISENTRRDVDALCPAVGDRLTTVHLGVGPIREESLSEERRQFIRTRYGLNTPYIFYCGSLSPRKNIVRTLEAFAAIKGNIPHNFVVTAGKSWKDRPVFDAVKRLHLSDRFVKLGTVPVEDMPALYGMADMFVYPSLYEGFGLPVLEAMACGCPVLTSNTSSLPEVAGDAALTVDPRDASSIASGMLKILTDREEAERLRNKGLERARRFTWEKTARETIDVFNSLSATTISVKPPMNADN